MALSKGRYEDEYPSLQKMLKKQAKDFSVKGYSVLDKLCVNLDASDVSALINETQNHIEQITQSEIKTCRIAVSEVRQNMFKEFNCRDLSTWVVEGGVKATWNRLKSHSSGMVVLSLYGDCKKARDTAYQAWKCLPTSTQITCSCLPNSCAGSRYHAICIAYTFCDNVDDDEQNEEDDETEDSSITPSISNGQHYDILSVPSEQYANVVRLELTANYVAKLLVYDHDMAYEELVSKMFLHTERVLWEVEMESKKRIVKYTIGQTYARQQKRKYLDYMDFKTFLKTGVSDRWSQTYKPEGYDGLIALCAVTRESRPRNVSSWKWFDQIQCVKALEQRLIQHFLLDKVDSRIANTSFQTGNTVTSAYAGVVYVAYMLSDKYSPIALNNPHLC